MAILQFEKEGRKFELEPHPWKVGDPACVGCVFSIGGSSACRSSPTCDPNNTHRIRVGKEQPPKPEWVGKHIVWKEKFV